MKRTQRSSSQSTNVLFEYVMVGAGLARVEHALGSFRRAQGGELVGVGRVAGGGRAGR